jgi:VWFA-related protein
MTRFGFLLLVALAGGGLFAASSEDGDIVFRSDVSLVRVDAQVVNRDNRTITGLHAGDFILREEGQPQKITSFASENMPVDVLLLLDVSASMRPHIQHIADASHQALRILGSQDRVGIMIFDRSTRLRMPFRNNPQDAERELESVLRSEGFNGGTDITRGLLDAASYVGREGRRDARRAIVIVTDDQTELNRDVEGVSRALTRADAVLCALLAPDAMRNRSGYPGGGRGRPDVDDWPGGRGSGGSIGGPLGGIIFGRPGPYGGGSGGRRSRGPVVMGPRTQSAGTAEIARRSGGDSMSVYDASAFEDTLARIRQRYALYFHLPQGVKPGEERNIEVQLADAARRRYSDAEVRYRQVYMAPDRPLNAPGSEPVVVSRASGGSADSAGDAPPVLRRRPAVNEDGSLGQPSTTPPADQGGWPRADQTTPQAGSNNATTTDQQPSQGGWRRVKPGEQP